ncbi:MULTISPECIES: NADP-dependent oxidoreductase [Streptomyces]|uniref:NADP-dependent oxidoreductase n=1 Tax=Streptomyces fuscus TaxID=3048495 RepID=A0ABT7J6H4_9ACTN|nr:MULTISPECIES: NADP-dependent oxidoreductase [Streptomyces]MCM1970963.1 NADP-dependent oxidoreductase [Streptomyces sp. G1]MDL2080461.1 NADP-dependent oxidoreductase [Streptomyces fuscus]
MSTMKAVVTTAVGEPDVLRLTGVERPAPLPTEVLVRVEGAGVNPVDWKIRSGLFPSGALGAPPFVQGWDVAGVVESGPRVTRFEPGDEVFGLIGFPRPGGAYAEYVTAPARQFARKPTRLSFEEAAALPLAGLTGWQTLVETARIQRGDKVLVTAAAGGVGHLAAQIARAHDAEVTGTARAEKHDFLREVGVDHPVDYRTGPLHHTVTGQDVVLDLLGGEHSFELLRTLRPGGLLITVIGHVSPELATYAASLGVRVTGFLVEPDHSGLEALAALVEAGRLKVRVDQVFKLAEAAKAHEYGESDRTTGKIVLVP